MKRSICLVAAVVMVASQSQGRDYDIDWWTVDGGGGVSQGGGYSLEGTIGQPDSGLTGANGISLTGGFWYPIPPGDCNVTGTVSLLDIEQIEDCLAGPDEFIDPPCRCIDFDSDVDVDLRDFSSFQLAIHQDY